MGKLKECKNDQRQLVNKKIGIEVRQNLKDKGNTLCDLSTFTLRLW